MNLRRTVTVTVRLVTLKLPNSWREKGIIEGIQKGIKEGIAIDIARATNLDYAEIEEISKQL